MIKQHLKQCHSAQPYDKLTLLTPLSTFHYTNLGRYSGSYQHRGKVGGRCSFSSSSQHRTSAEVNPELKTSGMVRYAKPVFLMLLVVISIYNLPYSGTYEISPKLYTIRILLCVTLLTEVLNSSLDLTTKYNHLFRRERFDVLDRIDSVNQDRYWITYVKLAIITVTVMTYLKYYPLIHSYVISNKFISGLLITVGIISFQSFSADNYNLGILLRMEKNQTSRYPFSLDNYVNSRIHKTILGIGGIITVLAIQFYTFGNLDHLGITFTHFRTYELASTYLGNLTIAWLGFILLLEWSGLIYRVWVVLSSRLRGRHALLSKREESSKSGKGGACSAQGNKRNGSSDQRRGYSRRAIANRGKEVLPPFTTRRTINIGLSFALRYGHLSRWAQNAGREIFVILHGGLRGRAHRERLIRIYNRATLQLADGARAANNSRMEDLYNSALRIRQTTVNLPSKMVLIGVGLMGLYTGTFNAVGTNNTGARLLTGAEVGEVVTLRLPAAIARLNADETERLRLLVNRFEGNDSIRPNYLNRWLTRGNEVATLIADNDTSLSPDPRNIARAERINQLLVEESTLVQALRARAGNRLVNIILRPEFVNYLHAMDNQVTDGLEVTGTDPRLDLALGLVQNRIDILQEMLANPDNTYSLFVPSGPLSNPYAQINQHATPQGSTTTPEQGSSRSSIQGQYGDTIRRSFNPRIRNTRNLTLLVPDRDLDTPGTTPRSTDSSRFAFTPRTPSTPDHSTPAPSPTAPQDPNSQGDSNSRSQDSNKGKQRDP